MDKTIEEYLVKLVPDLQAITRTLAETARSSMPGAHEMIYHDALGYGPTPSSADRICYIAPQKGYVNLGFFFGTTIDDPHHLLEGTGERMRHVKVRTLEAAKNPALADLIVAAWQNAPEEIAALHVRRKRGK